MCGSNEQSESKVPSASEQLRAKIALVSGQFQRGEIREATIVAASGTTISVKDNGGCALRASIHGGSSTSVCKIEDNVTGDYIEAKLLAIFAADLA